MLPRIVIAVFAVVTAAVAKVTAVVTNALVFGIRCNGGRSVAVVVAGIIVFPFVLCALQYVWSLSLSSLSK